MIVCFECGASKVCYLHDKEKFLCKKCYQKLADKWAEQAKDTEFQSYY